jgi:phosphoglycolate phosphatase-like HAD superfamily hydrolase
MELWTPRAELVYSLLPLADSPMDAFARLATAPLAAPAPLERPRARLALPKALLLDLDGTLIDTMPLLADLATDVLDEVYGMRRSLARELYIASCGLPFIRQLDSICPGDARNRFASDLFEARKPARCRAARMSEGTVAALTRLRARGCRVVVSSNNGVENVEAFAAASRFPFDLVLGYDGSLAKGRPHMERAEQAFGVTREDMVFVGDSLHDGEIAERESVRFVGVAGTFAKERFQLRFPKHPVIGRLAELPELFGR